MKKTYAGSCHCGDVRFEAKHSGSKTMCNCNTSLDFPG